MFLLGKLKASGISNVGYSIVTKYMGNVFQISCAFVVLSRKDEFFKRSLKLREFALMMVLRVLYMAQDLTQKYKYDL
jgi:hypothetical protein